MQGRGGRKLAGHPAAEKKALTMQLSEVAVGAESPDNDLEGSLRTGVSLQQPTVGLAPAAVPHCW